MATVRAPAQRQEGEVTIMDANWYQSNQTLASRSLNIGGLQGNLASTSTGGMQSQTYNAGNLLLGNR